MINDNVHASTAPRWRWGLILPLVYIALAAGCNSTEFRSHWTNQPIVLGTNAAAWDSAMVRIEEKNLMVALLNDNTNLYFRLISDDRSLWRQIMFRGLTVWFDYQGGQEKRFGIRFPLGPQFGGEYLGGERPRFGGDEGEPGDDSLRSFVPIDTNNVDILGPGAGEHHRISVAQLRQVAVRATISHGSLVYELKVPLADNGPDPYAIGTQAGSTIGMGLETGARMERLGEGDRGESPGGGDGRRGRGGYGGRGRGMEEGQRPVGNRPEALDVWAKVHLATSAPGTE